MATFRGKVRFFRPEQASGLAVIDIPAEIADRLGGLRQMKVRGSLNNTEFASNVMPAGGGVLALSVSKKLLAAAGSNGHRRNDRIAAGQATGPSAFEDC